MKKYLTPSIFFILLSISAIIIPLGISSDPGWGFLTLKSMLNGSTFCHSTIPDINNISRDVEEFSTWWTPGQYLVPGFFMYLFHLNIGQSIALTVILFSLLGIIGFYRLFITFGIEKKIAFYSIIVIMLQRYFSLPFSNYSGGEVLLFGGMPWVILVFEKSSSLKIYQILFIILVTLVGFLLKSSFLIIFIALVLYLALNKIILNNKPELKFKTLAASVIKKDKILYLGKLLLTFITTYAILYCFYIRFGSSPSNTQSFSFQLMDILVPLSSPLVSAFAIDDLLARIFRFPGFYSISTINANPIYFFLPLSIINILFFYCIFKKWKFSKYLLLTACLIFVYSLLFIYFYLFDAAISYEFRHFRILGLITIPLFLTYIANNKNRFIKYSLQIFVILISLYGLTSYIQRKQAVYKSTVTSKLGFNQGSIDKETLAKIHKLDDSLTVGNNLFYFTSPEITLEISKNRSMSTHADFESISFLSNKKYYGVVDNLYLMIQTKLENEGKEAIIKKSFIDYKYFIEIYKNENYKILKGIPN